jgi:hypothetical protein
MALKSLALETAAFLDSPQARALSVPASETRRVVEAFLEVCYEDLGKKPRLLDGDDVQTALTGALPSRLGVKDPAAEIAVLVLSAYFDHLAESQVVTQIFEMRRALEQSEPDFQEAVRSPQHPRKTGGPVDPFVHGAEKLGRNDPCSCGSGKKYKKCHGKSA